MHICKYFDLIVNLRYPILTVLTLFQVTICYCSQLAINNGAKTSQRLHQQNRSVLLKFHKISLDRSLNRFKACPFGLGLRKFAIDPVIVIFFKKCPKKKVLADPVVVTFFECTFFGDEKKNIFQKKLQVWDQSTN